MIFRKKINCVCPKCKKEQWTKVVWTWSKETSCEAWCVKCLWDVNTRIEGKSGTAIGGFPGNSYYVGTYERAITGG